MRQGRPSGRNSAPPAVHIDGPGGPIFATNVNGNENLPVDESGTLYPGEWTFSVHASAVANGDFFYYDYGFAAYELALDSLTTTAAPLADATREALLAIHPNPMMGHAVVSCALPSPRTTTIDVFDIRGRRVRSLDTGGEASGSVIWDGRGDDGRAASPGELLPAVARW